MMILRNLKLYNPIEQEENNGVLFLQDEDGKDWYENQKNFDKNTLKIAYNSDGIICSAYADVSMLWPINLTVTEVSQAAVPAEFKADGNWVYDGAVIKARTYSSAELEAKTLTQRGLLMAEATAAIAPLQDAVDLGVATGDEEAGLKAWKEYRMLLNRIDVTNTANITWPTKP